LYAIPESTPVGVAALRLPEQGIGLEFAEFRNVAQGSPRPRPQDPGASVLVLTVRNLDTIVQHVRAARVPIVTTGGRPVSHRSGGTTTRSIVVTDPDGYYIELIEHDPLPDSESAGNVLHAELMLSVADTDRTVHYYRDLLGLPLQVDASFAPDATLSKAFGIRHAQFRHSVATIPGTDFKYDFVEWKGVARHPVHARVFDHGVSVLRLVVNDVDSFVSNLKADGVPVASTGGAPIALSARFHTCILQDPNGLYIEPVPHFQPRRSRGQRPQGQRPRGPRAQ
ncbi:MAG: VOC family protein, partial [Rhodanobacteraceae bacterium]